MLTRLLTSACLPLLLTASLAAQEKTPTTKPSPEPTETDLQSEVTGVAETPEQRVAKLEAELAAIEAEFARIQEIEKQGGVIALVRRKLRNTTTAVPSFTPPSVAEQSQPRLLDEAERKRFPATTMFVVSGSPVVENEFNTVYEFLKTFRTDESEMRRDAMQAIAKQKAAMLADPTALLRCQQRSREAQKLIQDGKPFEKVCMEFSECESREDKGVIGGLERGSMDPIFMRVVSGLEPGMDSGVFPSTLGYHYVECLAKETGETPADETYDIRHILVKFSPRVEQMHVDVVRGKVEIAFRDQHDLDLFLR